MTIRPHNSKAGFTLAETMVATAVLGIALGACMLSFSMAMRTVNTASNQMGAIHFARNHIEGLRTNSFTASALTAGKFSVSNANYTGSLVITNMDTWTKNITINIAYRNRLRGGYSTNTLTTSITSTLHP